MSLLATTSSFEGRGSLQGPRPFAALDRAKSAAAPEATYALSGRLYLSTSGWLLLSVPNAVVRGLFDAMHEPGIELPPSGPDGKLCAHISVMTKAETEKIGPENINERGHSYRWQLGPMTRVEPKGWEDMAVAYLVQIKSPELVALRKSYGLTPLPHGDHPLHLTVAVRRKHVLRDNAVSKAAAAQDLGPTPANVASAATAAGSFLERASGRALFDLLGGGGPSLGRSLARGVAAEARSRLPRPPAEAGPRIVLRIPTAAPPAAPPAAAAPLAKQGALARFIAQTSHGAGS